MISHITMAEEIFSASTCSETPTYMWPATRAHTHTISLSRTVQAVTVQATCSQFNLLCQLISSEFSHITSSRDSNTPATTVTCFLSENKGRQEIKMEIVFIESLRRQHSSSSGTRDMVVFSGKKMLLDFLLP
jgi:hypothetical protein